MRKMIMILTLAMSWLALSATVGAAYPPPDCYPNCIVVR